MTGPQTLLRQNRLRPDKLVANLPRTQEELRALNVRARSQRFSDHERLLLDHITLRLAKGPDGKHVQRDRLVFVHVPKTAGTSFMQYLRRFFLPEEVLPDEEIRRGPAHWTAESCGRCRLFKGHFPFKMVQPLIGEAHFLTFFRDPVERVISNYFQWQYGRLRDRQMRLLEKLPVERARVERANELCLRDWILAQEEDGECYLTNLQTWALAGADDVYYGNRRLRDTSPTELSQLLQSAKNILHDQFAFFGLTERYRRSIHLFCYTFGLPGAFGKQVENYNQRPPDQYVESLDEKTTALIRSQNAVDLELYDYASQLFESRCARMQSDLLDWHLASLLANDSNIPSPDS